MTDSTHGKRRITALFDDESNAEHAFLACADLGYEIGDVHVVMSESTRTGILTSPASETGIEMARHKAEGGDLGGPRGGRLGVLVAAAAGVGTAIALPALGLVAIGPIATALTAAGAAGVASGLIAVFSDWGIPEERIREYESGIRDGGIVLVVDARSEDMPQIEQTWRAFGGRGIHA
jgi:hypothetical protein